MCFICEVEDGARRVGQSRHREERSRVSLTPRAPAEWELVIGGSGYFLPKESSRVFTSG